MKTRLLSPVPYLEAAPHVRKILDRVRVTGTTDTSYQAHCPAGHVNSQGSLSISVTEQGRILVRCSDRNCETAKILGMLELTWHDLMAEIAGIH